MADEPDPTRPKGVFPNPHGRPRVWEPTAEDMELIEDLAGIQCTVAEIAAVLHVAKRTFERYLEQRPDLAESLEAGRERGRRSLRRRMWEIVKSDRQDAGRVAMWLSKQCLGMRDSQHIDHTSDGEKLEVVQIYVPDNNRTPKKDTTK